MRTCNAGCMYFKTCPEAGFDSACIWSRELKTHYGEPAPDGDPANFAQLKQLPALACSAAAAPAALPIRPAPARFSLMESIARLSRIRMEVRIYCE